MTSRAATPPPASISTPADGRQGADRPNWWRRPGPRSRAGEVGAFGGMVRVPPGMREPGAGDEHRRRRHQGARGARRPAGSTRWARTSSITRSTTSWCTAPGRWPSWTTSPDTACRRRRSSPSSRGSPGAAARTAWRSPAARRRRCPVCMRAGTFDLAGTIVGVVEEDGAFDGDAIAPGRRPRGLRLHRAAHQRLHAGASGALRRDAPLARCRRARLGTTVGRRAAGGAPQLCRGASGRCWRGARPGAHHRRRHRRQPGAGPPRRLRRRGRSGVVALAAALSRCWRAAATSATTKCGACSISASA